MSPPDPIAHLAHVLEKQTSLQKEQIILLRRIDDRQAAADTSQQPMPQVPASSSSAWNPLLRSALDAIEPTVNRWRGGIDTLLIFIGLFSAIVTSFYVQSTDSLRQDEAARTNELLTNLTNILVLIHNVDPSTLTPPAAFEPDANDVRLNIYWSLSLVLSISLAALAVTCRGFLEKLTRSEHIHAAKKLTDVCARWDEAKKVLAPLVEALPHLMVIPVALFIVGLLDSLFSTALTQTHLSFPVLVAGAISSIFVGAVAAFLGYVLLDGVSRPSTSPFQTAISRSITRIPYLTRSYKPKDESDATLTPLELETYCRVVQVTHDDVSLDQAAAATRSLLEQSITTRNSINLLELEVKTILHLLSPEASLRSNLTAAETLINLDARDSDSNIYTYLIVHNVRGPLTRALTAAAKRYGTRFPNFAVLWDSTFTRALATINDGVSLCPAETPVFGLLLCEEAEKFFFSEETTLQLDCAVRYATRVLHSKLADQLALQGRSRSEEEEDRIMLVLFQPVERCFENIKIRSAVYRVLASLLLRHTGIYSAWNTSCLAVIRWLWHVSPEHVTDQTERLGAGLDTLVLRQLKARGTLGFLTAGLSQITQLAGRESTSDYALRVTRVNLRLLRQLHALDFRGRDALAKLDNQVICMLQVARQHLSPLLHADIFAGFTEVFRWYQEDQSRAMGRDGLREILIEEFRLMLAGDSAASGVRVEYEDITAPRPP